MMSHYLGIGPKNQTFCHKYVLTFLFLKLALIFQLELRRWSCRRRSFLKWNFILHSSQHRSAPHLPIVFPDGHENVAAIPGQGTKSNKA